ncbi:MAG TPA: 16S rRNA (guanine(966)-N(2))-methyltransferase RsmD [Candidatus Hydrogenedentes bacterium]|nr:16S rRNA (guanine(966)-N(2))-methyltransferase RsmD [Candidatus Hydrogenedentota bacterium]
MRVIAGLLKGRRLKAPPGMDIRPTSDRVRESLFNILGPRVTGCAFLDLFAGTGAVGLEALSRGAARVVWVDESPMSLAAIVHNLRTCGISGEGGVIPGRLPEALAGITGTFDLVFVDPPYAYTGEADLLAHPAWDRLTHPESLLIFERDIRRDPPGRAGLWTSYRSVRYGDTTLHFYRRQVAADEPA